MRASHHVAAILIVLGVSACGAPDDHENPPGFEEEEPGTGNEDPNPSTTDPDPSPGKLPPQLADPGSLPSDDLDGDTLPDALEDYLAEGFAPEVRLAPEDTARPASVDWYLQRVHLTFSHGDGCNDHELLAEGEVTPATLISQTHWISKGSVFCSDDTTKPVVSSKRYSEEETGDWKEVFFLQPDDDAVHAGAPQSEWKTYVHVKKSSYPGAAYDLQYWWFFPYNDATATINHEADWEHVTITVDANRTFVKIFYSQHSGGEDVTSPTKLYWVEDTRPVVYSAQGTHASYATPGAFDTEVPLIQDQAVDGGPKWQTWTGAGLVNVGERSKPLNDQIWIQYGGRWGEIGNLQDTSGPYGPATGGDWTTY